MRPLTVLELEFWWEEKAKRQRYQMSAKRKTKQGKGVESDGKRSFRCVF